MSATIDSDRSSGHYEPYNCIQIHDRRSIFGNAVGFRKLGVDLGNLLGLAKLLGGLGGDCGLWSKTSSHVNDDPEDTTSQN